MRIGIRRLAIVGAAITAAGWMLASEGGARESVAAPLAAGLEAAKAPQRSALPPGPLTGNTNLLGVLRLREPDRTLDRMCAFLQPMAPAMNAAVLRAQAAVMGLDFAQMVPGGNAAVFMWRPSDPQARPEGAALLPLVLGPAPFPNTVTAPFENYSLAAQNPQALERATADRALLRGAAQAPMAADLELTANLQAIWSLYGRQLQTQLRGMEGLLAMSMAATTNTSPEALQQMARQQTILKAEFQAMLDGLSQSDELGIGVRFDADAVELSASLHAHEGTPLWRMLGAAVSAAPAEDLTAFLSPGLAMRLQENIADPKAVADIYAKYMALALKSNETAVIRSLMADMERVGRASVAYGLSFDSTGRLMLESACVFEHPEQVLPALRQSAAAASSGPLHGLYREMGMDLSLTPRPARPGPGYTVEAFDFRMTPIAAASSEQRAVMQRMLGASVLEIAQVGRYTVMTMGQPVDGIAVRVAAGKPVAAGAAPGSLFHGSLDFAAYMNGVRALLPAAAAGSLPALGAGVPPVTFEGSSSAGRVDMRCRIPQALLVSVSSAARQKKSPPVGAPTDGPAMPPPAPSTNALPPTPVP